MRNYHANFHKEHKQTRRAITSDDLPDPSASLVKSEDLSDDPPAFPENIEPTRVEKRQDTINPYDSNYSGPSAPVDGSPSTTSCASGDTNCHSKSNSGSSTTTIVIVVGVIIPLTCALIAFFWLHRRYQKKQRAEDSNFKHGSLDFGLGEGKRNRGTKQKRNVPEMTLNGEKELRGRGLSLDIGGSPYMLPNDLTGSRPSLSRSGFGDDDPYTPIAMIKSNSHSPIHSRSQTPQAPRRIDSEKSNDDTSRLLNNAQPAPQRSSSPSLPEAVDVAVARKPIPIAKADGSPIPPTPPPKEESAPKRKSNFSLPGNVDRSSIHASAQDPMPEFSFDPPPPIPSRSTSRNVDSPQLDYSEQGWSQHTDGLGIAHNTTTTSTYANNFELPSNPEAKNNRNTLALPELDVGRRRLSSSTRPLPPDDPTDTAEQRANRIRSFYMEYFNDSSSGPANYGQEAEYYEDYGQEYLNEAAMYDPETGQFIVGSAPYADEHMTRRAMTPPPRAPPRFRGAPGQRAMSSDQYPPGGRARAYSSASGRPRPGPRGRPVKKLPPPKPLTTLPTPHKLKDMMTQFSPLDFAPPAAMAARAAGRPDSPGGGERRNYTPPSVRAHTPLLSPFQDLSSMPSPHQLRRSGTFTSLDFAPPMRFTNDGSGSDNGSIRSGRSGITKTGLANVRAGAYRLSRLPKDMVGTQSDLAITLKPSMDIGRR